MDLIKKTWCLLILSCASVLAVERPVESHFTLEEEEDPLHIRKDEVLILDSVITAQEARLALQKKLKEQMSLFQWQRESFAQGEQSQKHALAMVLNAREILGMIKEAHLSYLFPTDYLEELVFFSSIAGKSAPARP